MTFEIIVLLLIFIFGLVIGSFINALEYRIGTELSIAKGRSICPKCKKQIAWYDNVPVISYLFLAGRCRQCGKPISWQYPIVELATGLSFVAVAYTTLCHPWLVQSSLGGVGSQTQGSLAVSTKEILACARMTDFGGWSIIGVAGILCLLLATSCLLLIALHDAKTKYIVSPAVYVGIAAMVVYYLVNYTGKLDFASMWQTFMPLVVATAIPALVFAGLHYFSKGKWMGAGDIELAVLVGLFAGWPGILPAYYFAFIVGSIWGLTLVYLAKKAKMKSEMPFGPFLVVGAIFGFTFGQQIVDIYARIVLGV